MIELPPLKAYQFLNGKTGKSFLYRTGSLKSKQSSYLSLQVGLIIIGVSLPSADLAVSWRDDGREFSAATTEQNMHISSNKCKICMYFHYTAPAFSNNKILIFFLFLHQHVSCEHGYS